MNAWRPVLLFLLNFLVGWLVAHGVVDQTIHNDLVVQMADAVGYLIIFITSVASIWHAFKHPNHMPLDPQSFQLPQVPNQTVMPQSVKTEVKTEQIFSDPAPTNPGTPDL